MRSKILLAIIVAMLILIILSIDYPELRELVVILILTIMIFEKYIIFVFKRPRMILH